MPPAPPSLAEAGRYWLKLGLISFGGPAGQIAMMQSELVDRRRWIDQSTFLHALDFCMLLPGPEAQQLATYIGWRLNGIAGGLIAGILFVVPGALLLLVLSYVAAAHGDVPWVAALFEGVQPVVVAIILAALARIARRTLVGWAQLGLAGLAFLSIYALGVPFPLIILGAAALGLAGARLGVAGLSGSAPEPAAPPAAPESRRAAARLGGLAGLFALLWAVPVGLVLLLLGPDPYLGIAELFTTAAFVTFGGAYAVLPYIAEAAVESYGWLAPEDMVRGLALAETTPGPLILVTQFVGFFAGWNEPGALPPALAGLIGALLTLYVTFLPCFLFIFAGAPFVDRLSGNRWARAALAAITAAVVGVILNLGVYLGEAVFLPDDQPVAWLDAAVALAALALLVRGGLALHWAVLAGAGYGLLRFALGG